METKEVINVLRKEAEDPAANAVFKVWRRRKRARGTVTVPSLERRMEMEGHAFSKAHYTGLLKKLSALGFGTLKTDSNGEVKALADITATLQSIGAAALGEKIKIENFRQRAKYHNIVERSQSILNMAKSLQGQSSYTNLVKEEGAGVEYPVAITVVVNGKPVNIRIPTNFSPEDLADLIGRFRK